MISVEIQNFQSIESATLEINGFVALVGRSNIGKSAVIRAVHAAITNASGTSFVRHGPECVRRLRGVKTCKCFSRVRMVGDGFDLTWEKGDAVGRYELNGKSYDAIARGFPDFLAPDWTPVKVGSETMSIQVAPQWQPLFLLDESGGVVADVLSDVAQLDRINAAVRLVESDRREVMSTLKVREKDRAGLQIQLNGFQGLDVALEDAAKVDPAIQKAKLRAARLKVISSYRTRALALYAEMARLKPVLVLQLPVTVELENQVVQYRAMAALLRRLLEAALLIESLQGVDDVDDVETEALEGLAANARDIVRFCAAYLEIETSIAGLVGVEEVDVPVTGDLTSQAKRVRSMRGFIARLRALKTQYQGLLGVPDVEEPDSKPLEGLWKALQSIRGLRERLAGCEAAVARLEAELEGLAPEEQVVQDELANLGVCPVCQRPTGDHGDHR
jgi:hypothetical protein